MQMVFSIVTGIIGGVALFLFGMDVLSHSLTELAGGQFENYMNKFTDNKAKSWFLGTVVTAIMQSSSATIVLTVGLVNSGMLQLSQAASIIIGANLGTTATAWILSLNSLDGSSLLLTLCKPTTFVPYMAVVGVALMLFAKSDKKKQLGRIMVGFATMMIGMKLMSDAVAPLKDSADFKSFFITFSNPLIGFLFAIVLTMIIESSDAAVGMLQALAISITVNVEIAIPIICGAQIGTCITAILSSLGAEKNGKRTALIQLYYNLIKTVPFMCIFSIIKFTSNAAFLQSEISAVGIAAFHSLLNIVFSIILLPLSGLLVTLSVKTIPYDEKELRRQSEKLSMLDPLLLDNPIIAIDQTGRALRRISENIQNEFDSYMEQNLAEVEELYESSTSYIKQTSRYCEQITKRSMSEKDMNRLTAMQRIYLDYESVNESIKDLSNYLQNMKNDSLSFRDITKKDLAILGEATREILSMAMCGLMTGSSIVSQTIWYYREVIADLQTTIKMRYVKGLENDETDQKLTIYFTDLCYSYDKIVTRCASIAEVLVRLEKKKRKSTSTSNKKAAPEVLKNLFKDKYSVLKA